MNSWDVEHENNQLCFNIKQIMGLTAVKGQVGLEIEVEGRNLPHEEVSQKAKMWKYTVDHSLRGEDNGEYVLRKAIKFSEVPKALSELWKVFEEYKTKFDESNRTSVHVHLNCQDFHLNRLASFAALYFSVEELLTEWCGDYRVGNLFCLRAKDAPAIATKLRDFIRKNGKHNLPDHLHYSGFNIHSLTKFGSIEIRTLRGVDNPEIIQQWVDILQRIYDLSEVIEDPRQICQMFSSEGPTAFLDYVLGPCVPTLKNGINKTDAEIRSCLFDGIRTAQDICYARDWGVFKKAETSLDPFGRPIEMPVDSPISHSQAQVYQSLVSASSSLSYWYSGMSGETSSSSGVEPLINESYINEIQNISL